ncbi:hypothetical protein J7M07_03720 [bacterium]|nr:hypothetical protein [bacterium]
MKKSFKVVFAVLLLCVLSTSIVSAQDPMGIPVDVKISGGGCTYVYFNGIMFRIASRGDYYFDFEEYDDEWVSLRIIPYEQKPEYHPVYIQWGTFDTVVLTLETGDDGIYLLGSETGYAEK